MIEEGAAGRVSPEPRISATHTAANNSAESAEGEYARKLVTGDGMKGPYVGVVRASISSKE